MLQRSILITAVVSVMMLFILLTTTTPSTIGPLGILGFFIFMYLAALGVLTFCFRGVSILLLKVAPLKRRVARPKEMTVKSAYYYASVTALVPVMLVAMQSVGQIGVYQILLMVFFIIIAWLYVTNRTA